MLRLHAIDDLREQLDARLRLSLHQEDHTFSEEFIIHQLSLVQLELRGPLEVVMSFVEVLLLNLNLGDLVERGAGQEVVLGKTQNLLEVEHGVIHVVHLLQSFGFVEVGLAQRNALILLVLFLCQLGELVEIFQRFFILL